VTKESHRGSYGGKPREGLRGREINNNLLANHDRSEAFRQVYENELKEFAYRLVNQCMRIRKNENISIYIINTDDMFLPNLVARECIKVGAYPVIIPTLRSLYIHELMTCSPDYLRIIPRHLKAFFDNVEANITIMSPYLPPVTPEKRRALDDYDQGIAESIVRRKVKTITVYFPSQERAEETGKEYDEVLQEFIHAVNVDYDKMENLATKLRNALQQSSKIRIVTEKGTDLTFSIKGRKVFTEDGVIGDQDLKEGVHYGEIPTGEVFTTPIEDSANGIAVFDNVHGTRNVRLNFKQGTVIDAMAQSGIDKFWRRVNTATGESKRIAEFAVGLNPNFPENQGVKSEKALGTIHIALGRNTHLGGKNESSLHWDLVMDRPTIFADNRIIMDKGTVV